MARKNKELRGGGTLHRAASAVKRLFTSDGDASAVEEEPKREPPQRTAAAEPSNERAVRRESDIPIDLLDQAYNPPLTSSKASFRSDGADHQQDQEYALGVADDRWNDEDHYSNKSGDPRIGTRGRTYEPAEAQPETRK